MKKTLTRKLIKGHEYFYLVWKKKGRQQSEYLGKSSSTKFKKYLYSLTNQPLEDPLVKARSSFFRAGLPVCYVEDQYLVLEYKNGAKEYMNSAYEVKKVGK